MQGEVSVAAPRGTQLKLRPDSPPEAGSRGRGTILFAQVGFRGPSCVDLPGTGRGRQHITATASVVVGMDAMNLR